MPIKCPHCQAEYDKITIDISIIIPFKVDSNGKLSTQYRQEDLVSQSNETVADDMVAFCNNCGTTSEVVLDEETGNIIGLTAE